MNEEIEKDIGRESRWTAIYWAVEDGELRPCVRLTPDFLEMEKLGFSHGLSVSPTFATEEEATRYADRIDAFIEAMVREANDTSAATSPAPSGAPSWSIAPLGGLRGWIKALLSVQLALALLSFTFLMVMLVINTEQAWAMHQLAASVIDSRYVPAMNELASVFEATRKASPWWAALCLVAAASSVLGAILICLIPRKRSSGAAK